MWTGGGFTRPAKDRILWLRNCLSGELAERRLKGPCDIEVPKKLADEIFDFCHNNRVPVSDIVGAALMRVLGVANCGNLVDGLFAEKGVQKMMTAGNRAVKCVIPMPPDNNHAFLLVGKGGQRGARDEDIVMDIWKDTSGPVLAKDTNIQDLPKMPDSVYIDLWTRPRDLEFLANFNVVVNELVDQVFNRIVRKRERPGMARRIGLRIGNALCVGTKEPKDTMALTVADEVVSFVNNGPDLGCELVQHFDSFPEPYKTTNPYKPLDTDKTKVQSLQKMASETVVQKLIARRLEKDKQDRCI